MAKENDQFAREKKLAREYEKKMEVRTQAIKKKILRELSVYQISPYESRDFTALLCLRVVGTNFRRGNKHVVWYFPTFVVYNHHVG